MVAHPELVASAAETEAEADFGGLERPLSLCLCFTVSPALKSHIVELTLVEDC